MVVQVLIKNITDKLSTTTSVKAVFGEPTVAAGKTIIPIATVRLGFGAGGGEAKHITEEGEGPKEEGSGGGGGGGGVAKPLAILEVSEDETKVISILDVTQIVVSSLMFATMATYMITKLLSRKTRLNQNEETTMMLIAGSSDE